MSLDILWDTMLPTFSVQFDNFLHSVDEYSFQPSKCYNEGKLT